MNSLQPERISDKLQILEGSIAPRALGLVMEWASQHQDDLMKDWDLAVTMKEPFSIDPLK